MILPFPLKALRLMSLCYKQKRGFHTTSFTFYLLFLSILLWNLYVRCVIYISIAWHNKDILALSFIF